MDGLFEATADIAASYKLQAASKSLERPEPLLTCGLKLAAAVASIRTSISTRQQTLAWPACRIAGHARDTRSSFTARPACSAPVPSGAAACRPGRPGPRVACGRFP